MKPATKGHIKAMRDINLMTDIEIWRDTMCAEMKVPEAGKCTTPDGVIERDIYCTGCRYSNRGKSC